MRHIGKNRFIASSTMTCEIPNIAENWDTSANSSAYPCHSWLSNLYLIRNKPQPGGLRFFFLGVFPQNLHSLPCRDTIIRIFFQGRMAPRSSVFPKFRAPTSNWTKTRPRSAPRFWTLLRASFPVPLLRLP